MPALFSSTPNQWRIIGLLGLMTMLVGCNHMTKVEPSQDAWLELFDGESLTGWTQVNGSAPYEIVDGAIRGTNVLDTPNSFLATNEAYSDFVLEFESRSIGAANSGVQFRTELAPGTWSGLVGYQLDIDPTERRWTGGIYHEGVHVWRHSMARNADCQSAYHHGEWNRYRIEAVGTVLATWVNGIPCAHIVGDHHDRGLIALQVHSIGREATYLGSYTEWRGVRLLEDPTPRSLWLERRSDLVEGWLANEISDVETGKGGHAVDTSSETTEFELPDEAFEFVIDMQVGHAAEGHLAYTLSGINETCVGAYKILDDSSHEGSDSELDLMGSFPGKIAAKNLSEPGRPKRFYPDGKWNRVRLIATADKVEHWLNSVKVVEYARCALDLPTIGPLENEMRSGSNRLKLVTESGRITPRNAKVRAILD